MICLLQLGCGDEAYRGATSEDETAEPVGLDGWDPGDTTAGTDTPVPADGTASPDTSDTVGAPDIAPVPDTQVILPEPPLPGSAGACSTVAVLGCGDHADGYLDGAVGFGGWGCGLWPLDTEPSAERTVAIWTPETTVATLRLTRDLSAGQSLFVRLLGASEAGCEPADCRAFSVETRFQLLAGQVRYATLESWSGERGDWSLDLECCVPDCAGKTCGADRCGGSCGDCPATGACLPACDGRVCGADGCGESCGVCGSTEICRVDGTCASPAPGSNDTCAQAVEIGDLPFEVVGTTAGLLDDVSPSGDPGGAIVQRPGCIRSETGGRDAIYRFTAAVAGTLRARLVPVTAAPCGPSAAATCPPSLLYAVSSCASESCLAAGDFLWDGAPALRVPVKAGQTVYLVVDGQDATETGPYHLLVETE